MKVSYNTNGLRHLTIKEALKTVRNYNYDGVELSFHENHLHPLMTTRKEVEELKNFCSDHNIIISCISAGADNLLGEMPFEPSLINPNKACRSVRKDFLKRSIEIANNLNSPYLVFASGKLKDNIDRDMAYSWLLESIEELLSECGGLTLLIEPEPEFLISTSTGAIQLIKDSNNEHFKMNLDIGHVNCCEDDYLNAIDKALPFTKHIHIEDIKDRIHYHEILGQGHLDFPRIFSILSKHNYDGFVSVELYNHTGVHQKALKESYEFINKHIELFPKGQLI
ncbi:sugar phosphate isomerase/epimerase family protein [Paenibacillus donghaensis]|uniref:Xylose isomerase-like TIM barrel domain-containing protein n=1 Tax=Paenibacillus donghaensis TaxID=414771 RepID=A0A2Z2KUG3_9BACL|nr:sugar phosphate isomerase/epimerase family protein [Paenibacillus donghaensis]ASA25732.1 hypothetical protein B9T62_36410 [Paenibacillus donghaensis]